jgi:acyl dehydratase
VLTFATTADLLPRKGDHFGWSEWIDVDQKTIDAFADVTGDHQWIHTDPERAAGSPFGGTIAHGLLVLSLVSPRIAELFEVTTLSAGLNYGFDKVRFVSPVPSGSAIRVGATLGDAQPVAGGVRCSFDAEVQIKDRDRPACVARNVIQFLD